METYYILIVAVLFLLAISDLIVGVSNDAVNFLNSAIGSKAAPFKIILAIAAVGVLVGATFSNGMMEVARKGIFNPELFAFQEIMIVFLAVMLTDILLLDFFNTMGLPTSTTVSIVFELLGSAVAVAVYKVARTIGPEQGVSDYINIESSVMIIVGIFLSVIIAFSVGLIIQWLVRLVYSFNIKKSFKYWNGLWGGFAITAILNFLLIKGAKGSTLISPEALNFIHENTRLIMVSSFIGFTVLFQLLTMFTKVNVMKITVLVGTFALAMAFAGNDLVNFIGVPLAGFESFKAFMASGGGDASGFMMSSLTEKVNTPIYFLIIAGLIMVMTLRFSKKAKSVTATSIDLSRQGEGSERFASSSLARFLVRRAVETSTIVSKIAPKSVVKFVESRFDQSKEDLTNDGGMAFDLVRASVNLVVASILIAIGTSLKLPLSTTYVTFMVAMGTSLADGAWGRESAVYRITGVLTVVGGWFFTAFSAFLASFLIASIIFFGKMPAILILIGLAIFLLIRTHAYHKKRAEKQEKLDSQFITASYEVLDACDKEVRDAIVKASDIYKETYNSFFEENHKKIKSLKKSAKKLDKQVKSIRENIPDMLRKFEESELESGHHYVQVVAYMKEMSNSLMYTVQPAFNHLDNNHPLDQEQNDVLKEFNEKSGKFFDFAINMLINRDFDNRNVLVERRDEMIHMANDIMRSRIKILKKTQKGAKVSMTYMEMLSESKNLFLNIEHLVKSDAVLQESMQNPRPDIDTGLLD